MVRKLTLLGTAAAAGIAAATIVKIVKRQGVVVEDMRWSLDENSKWAVRFVHEQFVVEASMLDTGEWVIHYGAENPDRLYTRNLFSRSDAIGEAKACVRDFTAEIVSDSPVPEADR